jgi:hypothetical protein
MLSGSVVAAEGWWGGVEQRGGWREPAAAQLEYLHALRHRH